MNSLLFLSILITLASCSGQNGSPIAASNNPNDQKSGMTVGDTVSALDNAIFVVFQDQRNNYWFGSDGRGVYYFNGKSILHFSTKDGLCNNRIREIQEDRSGNIIFTTLDGISKFDGKKFTTLPVSGSSKWKLEPDDLWLKGEPGKNGPYRYDGDSLYDLEFPKHHMEDEFYARIPDPPYSPYEVYAIYRDSKDNVWFGTSNFGISRYDGKSLSWMYEKYLTEMEGGNSFGSRSIIEDSNGQFWFSNTNYRYNIFSGEKEKGLINYKREIGISGLETTNGDEFIYFVSIVKDTNNDLWMATYDSGVWRYNGKNAVHYPVDKAIYSIYKDNRGDIWLGTQEAGAYKFNGKTFEKFRA